MLNCYCSQFEVYPANVYYVFIFTGKIYLRHPDSYLPTIHTLSDTEAESSNAEPLVLKKVYSKRKTTSGKFYN